MTMMRVQGSGRCMPIRGSTISSPAAMIITQARTAPICPKNCRIRSDQLVASDASGEVLISENIETSPNTIRMIANSSSTQAGR